MVQFLDVAGEEFSAIVMIYAYVKIQSNKRLYTLMNLIQIQHMIIQEMKALYQNVEVKKVQHI